MNSVFKFTVFFLILTIWFSSSVIGDSKESTNDQSGSEEVSGNNSQLCIECYRKYYDKLSEACPLFSKERKDAAKKCWKSLGLIPTCEAERVMEDRNLTGCPDPFKDQDELKKEEDYLEQVEKKCLFKCIGEEIKVMNETGFVNRSKAIEVLQSSLVFFKDEKWKPELRKKIDDCYDIKISSRNNTSTGPSACEDAHYFYMCYEDVIITNMTPCLDRKCEQLMTE